MKRLTFFRHAKSGWDQAAARDFDRGLNERGRRASAVVGRHLRDEGVAFDRIVASPAVRVAETLDAMQDGYGRKLSPTWDRRIYLASAANLLEVIQETPDAVDALMLAGHNPGIEELVLALLAPADGQRDAARVAIEEKYPTASIAELSFAVDRWEDVDQGGGRLVRFVRPRDLDPELGPDIRD